MKKMIKNIHDTSPKFIKQRLYLQSTIIAIFLITMIFILIWTGNTLVMITAIARFERTHTASRLQAKASLLNYLDTRIPQVKQSFFENMGITQSYNKVFSNLLSMRKSKSKKEFVQILEDTFEETDHKTAVIIVNRIKILYWHPTIKELVGYAGKANSVGESILRLGKLAMKASNKELRHSILSEIDTAEKKFMFYEHSFSKGCSNLANEITNIVNYFSIIVLILSVGFTALIIYLILKSLLQQAVSHATELKENEERLNLVLDGSQLGYWDWNINTGTVFRNNYCAEFLGYSLEEMKLNIKQLNDLIHPDDKDVVWQSINDHLEGRSAHHKIEFRMRTKDGQYKWILDQAKIVSRDLSGKPIRMCGTYTDITDRKRAEKKLQQSQKMEAIGTLAGGIAHDFNNMLGVIIGNISYALSSLNKHNELYEVLLDAKESSKQAQSLTQQILTFSKGGAPIKAVTDINRLIKSSPFVSTRGAKVSYSFFLDENLWLTEIDEGQMNQVIGNIFVNANQAMPQGGTITIKTDNVNISAEDDLSLSAGRYIKIEIEDQGAGISKNDLSNIFEPYFTTKKEGSGLGLATAYSIIKRHDGHIYVYSEIEKGTVFKIYLPASDKILIKSKEKQEQEYIGQGKVLIMDDQESILKMTGRILNRLGYEAVFARDGSEAIEKYSQSYKSQNTFDLVITDLTVPDGMGGAETIIELLKIDSNVKAIVSSGYSNDPIMANYEKYGFCGVLPKPYTKAQLSEVMNRIISETNRTSSQSAMQKV